MYYEIREKLQERGKGMIMDNWTEGLSWEVIIGLGIGNKHDTTKMPSRYHHAEVANKSK